jgi:hypothetical protein
VDGVLKDRADAPSSGDSVPTLQLSGFFESERFMRLPDLVKAAAIHRRAFSAAEVKAVFDRRAGLVDAGLLTDEALHFTLPPYLNTPTT